MRKHVGLRGGILDTTVRCSWLSRVMVVIAVVCVILLYIYCSDIAVDGVAGICAGLNVVVVTE